MAQTMLCKNGRNQEKEPLEKLELVGGRLGTRWAKMDSRSTFVVGVLECVSR